MAVTMMMTTKSRTLIKRKSDEYFESVPMADLLESGYLALIDRVYCDELERNDTLIKDTELSIFRTHCINILASMSKEVLSGLANGDLAKRHMNGDFALVKLYGMPDSMEDTGEAGTSGQKLPCLYACALLDDHGDPPTPEQKLRIVSIMRRYIGDDPEDLEMIIQMDQKIIDSLRLFPPAVELAEDGYRAYLMPSMHGVDRRRWLVRRFCNGVKQLCKSPRLSILAETPWFDIRCSLVPIDETVNYKEDQTGFIGRLITGIAEIEYPGTFREKTFVLAHLADKEEIAFGQILLAGITTAHHYLGTGTYLEPNCLREDTCRAVKYDDDKEYWPQCQTFRNGHTDYLANLEHFKKTPGNAEKLAKKRKQEQQRLKEKFSEMEAQYIAMQSDY